ncbi:CUB domain-containing protein 1 [Gadus morhua]|nr:CUB domain-containing protein 1-like [Gadus morhua]
MGVRGGTRRVAVTLGCVLLSMLYLPESLQMTVTPDAGATVTVHSQGDSCTLCTGNATVPAACDSTEVSLPPGDNVTLHFSCSETLGASYRARIQRAIACTKDRCSPAQGVAQASFLSALPRTLTWALAVPEDTMAELNLIGDGLKEAAAGDAAAASCPDGSTYVLTRTTPDGGPATRTYCRGGSTTALTLPGGGALTLALGPGVEAPPTVFSVTAKPLKGPTVPVTLDPGLTMVIRRAPGRPQCGVCTDKGARCSPTDVSLSKAQAAELEFGCPEPQEVFNVRLQRMIDCTETACTPPSGELLPGLLSDFRRTFSWDVSLARRSVLTLDFPAPGLKETTAEDGCQDAHKYSVRTSDRGGETETTYCSGGPLTQLMFLGKTSLALEVPRGAVPDKVAFRASAAPRPSRTTLVTPDPNTDIILKREGEEPDCEVCVGPKCDPSYLNQRYAGNFSVVFGCPGPQDLYEAQIIQEIDCNKTACPVRVQSTLFPDFNRTFNWDMKVLSTQTILMAFPAPGLRQVAQGDTCLDGHTFVLLAYPRTGVVQIGTYCRGGPLTTVQVRYKARMMLSVPRGQTPDPGPFELSVGPETDMLAILTAELPRGVSNTSFSSAHYPGWFPTEEQMTWDVRVPGMHNYSVVFTDHRLPEKCLSGKVRLRYQGPGGKVTPLGLDAPQPRHKQGNFNLSLSNCMPNQTLDGLRLDFTVSVMRSGHPVLCTVDLTKQTDLTLQIEKVGSDPNCELSLDSVMRDAVRVAPGTQGRLSFLDCPKEDLRLTASRVIDGSSCRGPCLVAEALLTVPPVDACLPVALSSFTWHLLVPANATLDLRSPAPGGLRQSLPGQECGGAGALSLVEGVSDGGRPIGTFCQQGVLERMQVHGNVSVTVATRGVTRAPGPVLNVSVTDEISEHIIYTVRPQFPDPALLATPNWPEGMRPSSTVSWMVQVPPQFLALVQFPNVTQPSCAQRHTSIKVQQMGSKEEKLSRREDEKLEDTVVSESFYLNMSNCVPDRHHFSALSKVSLQPSNSPVGIILGVLGAVLLLVLVFVAVGLLVRKKKKNDKEAREASIYIGKGNMFRPGDAHFAKVRSDNASHVYDAIDENMVYGHLLRDSTLAEAMPDRYNGMQLDSYRTFTGPPDGGSADATYDMDEGELGAYDAGGGGGGGGGGSGSERYQTFLDPADSFLPPRPRTPIGREESLGYQDRRMVDNALYTFKGTSTFNTIRLSGADQQDDDDL